MKEAIVRLLLGGPYLAIHLFEERRALLAPLLVIANQLQLVHGEVVEALGDLIDVHLVVRQNRRIWCSIWDESGHEGGFSTRWHLLSTPVNKTPIDAPDPPGWHHGMSPTPRRKTPVGKEDFYVGRKEHGSG